jgi:pimeloyl-ACP methyl ester carboxylesterase
MPVGPTRACQSRSYRSAVHVAREWAPDFHDVPAPGLVILPADDPVLGGDGARAAARRAGATTAGLPGLGHWWILQDPAQAAAAALEEFWRRVT